MDTKKGREIYQKLLPSILPYYKGSYITIHVPSKEYWIDDMLVSTLKKASEKYKDHQFYSVKIGEEGVAEFR